MALLCHVTWKMTIDGVDSSIECLAACASLQKLQDSQILTLVGKGKFKIYLTYIQSREVEDTRVNLQLQFDIMQPIQVICSYQAFIPETSLVVKKCSETLIG
jgi:hypothetical protein